MEKERWLGYFALYGWGWIMNQSQMQDEVKRLRNANTLTRDSKASLVLRASLLSLLEQAIG